ncbi:hypothetical protein MD484_g8742, partial [Candolleomyces efflorescens]
MDSFYDHSAARAWLEQYMVSRVQGDGGDKYLTTLRIEQGSVIKYAEPRSLRMVEQVSGGTWEVEVKIPGIICSKTLPPQIRELSVSNDEQVRLLRQFVKLSGLGSPMFEEMAGKIEEIREHFSRAASPGVVLPVEFKGYDGDFAIDAHTRYFTDRRHAPSLKHEELPLGIDPHRFLDVARGANFIYTAENAVEYCQAVVTDGEIRYEAVGPENFEVGDVVEVGACFVGYPAGKDRFVLKVAMRSLCLVNKQFRQDSANERVAFQANQSATASTNPGKRVRQQELVYSGPLLRRRKLTEDAGGN